MRARPFDLMSKAKAMAEAAKALDMDAHAATKRRIRKRLVRRIRWGKWLDLLDAAMIGLRRYSRS